MLICVKFLVARKDVFCVKRADGLQTKFLCKNVEYSEPSIVCLIELAN